MLWSAAYVLSGWALETASPGGACRSAGSRSPSSCSSRSRCDGRGFVRTLREPRTILLGLTGVTLYYSFANIGLLFTTPGTAALTAAFLPVLTAGAAVALIHERLERAHLGRARTRDRRRDAGRGIRMRVDVGVLLNIVALASYALYTVLLRKDAGRSDSPDALVLATATGVWGTLIMLPWLAWEAFAGTIAAPSDPRGMISIVVLALVVTAPTLVLFNYGAERLPAAISGVATAAIPRSRLRIRPAARRGVRPGQGRRRSRGAHRCRHRDARDAGRRTEPARARHCPSRPNSRRNGCRPTGPRSAAETDRGPENPA